MKETRKLLSLLLAIVMIFSLAMTAFADDDDDTTPPDDTPPGGTGTSYTITIDNSVEGYHYKAYQIFKGIIPTTGEPNELSHITWGSGLTPQGRNDLAIDFLYYNPSSFDPNSTNNIAVKVAEKLSELMGDNPDALALNMAKFLTAKTENYNEDGSAYTIENVRLTDVAKDSEFNAEKKQYVIEDLEPGYYLIDNDIWPNGEGDIRSQYMVKVVKNIEVKPKASVPSVEKKILEGEGENQAKVDANSAGIGETVQYEIVGTLPDNYSEYKCYYYLFTDTLSKGLDFNEDSLQVFIENNGVEVQVERGFTRPGGVEHNSNDGTATVHVEFKNLKAACTCKSSDGLAVHGPDCWAVVKSQSLQSEQIQITANTKIIVRYSATVNADAVIRDEGNPNKVYLRYQNDPYYEYLYDIVDFVPPTGKTPESTVKTYLTDLTVFKYETLDTGKSPLTGAEFQLACTNGFSYDIVTKDVYTESESGEWYKRRKENSSDPDTYTTTPPSTDVEIDYNYVYPYTKYIKEVKEVIVPNPASKSVRAEVGTDGKLTFTGLGAGEYTLTETKAPEGYNLLDAPITFSVGFHAGNGTYEFTSEDPISVTDNALYTDVENNKGATLPETGGMGTTLFYIVGGILAVGAGILLISKKRMSDMT